LAGRYAASIRQFTMPLKLAEIKRRAKEYVELEAETEVLKVAFVKRYQLFGREDIVLTVTTTDRKDPEWWVIGGSTPMNLYSKRQFPEQHLALSLHQGLIVQLMDRNYLESSRAPGQIGYDAFISYASEDKANVAKPLARALASMGFIIWCDEFELEAGDSLRRSIDQGLANSRHGIVVLSPDFFAKNWPQYELNGLTARESDGRKLILPIWHNVDQHDVLAYSPMLADKVALSTGKMSIKRVAELLATVLRRP
jgi:hypothetical protein